MTKVLTSMDEPREASSTILDCSLRILRVKPLYLLAWQRCGSRVQIALGRGPSRRDGTAEGTHDEKVIVAERLFVESEERKVDQSDRGREACRRAWAAPQHQRDRRDDGRDRNPYRRL